MSHERDGRFFFDSEENEHAKVELEAVKLGDETARAEAVRIWQRDVFRDTRHSVVFQDPVTTRQAFEALDRKPPRYVLGPAPQSATVSTWAWSGATRCLCWSRATTAQTIWSIRTCWRWHAVPVLRPSSWKWPNGSRRIAFETESN